MAYNHTPKYFYSYSFPAAEFIPSNCVIPSPECYDRTPGEQPHSQAEVSA